EHNPLRLLDCKEPGCRQVTADAPVMLDHLCEPCRAHFEAVRTLVDREGVAPQLNPRMVRGLDYYCRTAFEIVAEGLGAQNAVGGGGRYDGLVKALGGPDAAGIGFALGMERLLLAIPESAAAAPHPDIFIAPLGAAAEAEGIHLAHRWRRGGLPGEVASGGKSLKSQMRLADKVGARYVVILGDDELHARALTVRDMSAKRDFVRALDPALDGAQLRDQLARLDAPSGPTPQP